MKQIVSVRKLMFVALAMALMAVFPGVAAANLYIEETFETIPEKTLPAEAPVVTAEAFPATVTGERLELGGNMGKLAVLETSSGSIDCDAVEIDGGTLSGPVYGLELTAEYSNCEFEGGSATVSMNSCKYRLSGFEPLNDKHYTDVAGEIVCDEEDAIEINVSGCPVTVPPQALNVNSEVANVMSEGKKLLAAGIIGSGVTYNIPYEYFCHTLIGLPVKGTHEDGALESDIGMADVFIEETFETIPEETLPAEAPVVAAKAFPATVTGERLELGGNMGKLVALDTGSGSFICDSVEIDGGTLTKAASQLTLAADYSSCELETASKETAEATVSMNSCKYRLSDFEPLTTYYTDVAGEIVCDEEDAIEMTVAGCSVTIPPQPLNVSSEVANIAPEGEKLLAAGIFGSSVTYNIPYEFLCHTLAGLPVKGTHEDGTLHSDVALSGS